MPEANDTVAPEEVAPETEAPQVNGTDVDESTDAPATEEPKDNITVDPTEVERLRKEKQKLEMELNLRRKEVEKAEKERIEKEADAEKRAEMYKAKLDEIEAKEEADRQEREANELRNKVLDQFPEVADVAKDLNLWWDNAQTVEEAEAQLRSKLEALQSKFAPKTETEESAPEIHANNPATNLGDPELVKLASMSSEEMRKILPKAEPR